MWKPVLIVTSCLLRTVNAQQQKGIVVGPTNEEVALARLTYENQKRERRRSSKVEAMNRIGANWPCMWGERATATMRAFRNRTGDAL
eukprot:6084873-Prymnesium_polylepis.1